MAAKAKTNGARPSTPAERGESIEIPPQLVVDEKPSVEQPQQTDADRFYERMFERQQARIGALSFQVDAVSIALEDSEAARKQLAEENAALRAAIDVINMKREEAHDG